MLGAARVHGPPQTVLLGRHDQAPGNVLHGDGLEPGRAVAGHRDYGGRLDQGRQNVEELVTLAEPDGEGYPEIAR